MSHFSIKKSHSCCYFYHPMQEKKYIQYFIVNISSFNNLVVSSGRILYRFTSPQVCVCVSCLKCMCACCLWHTIEVCVWSVLLQSVMFHFNLLMPVDVWGSFHGFQRLPMNESVIILLVFNIVSAAVSLVVRR